MFSLNVDESRRLTGPNLLSDNPGAVMEVYVDGVENSQVIESWKKHLQQILTDLDLKAEIYHRSFSGGVNLAFSADEDMLYAACEINEAALELARAELTGEAADPETTSIRYLQRLLSEERNPRLMELINLANENHITYLVDDDELSFGMGPKSHCWPVHQLPEPGSINWADYEDIPVALITGT